MNYKQNYFKHYGYYAGEFIPCVNCHKTAIDLHHVIFRSHGGSDEVTNLVPLCRVCHTRAHNDKEFNESLKKYL